MLINICFSFVNLSFVSPIYHAYAKEPWKVTVKIIFNPTASNPCVHMVYL